MCRIGDACKQGMISLFSYLPEGEKLLTKNKTKRTSIHTHEASRCTAWRPLRRAALRDDQRL